MISPLPLGTGAFGCWWSFHINFILFDDWFMCTRICAWVWANFQPCLSSIFRYEYTFDRVAMPLRGRCFRLPVFYFHFINFFVFLYYDLSFTMLLVATVFHLLCYSHATSFKKVLDQCPGLWKCNSDAHGKRKPSEHNNLLTQTWKTWPIRGDRTQRWKEEEFLTFKTLFCIFLCFEMYSNVDKFDVFFCAA